MLGSTIELVAQATSNFHFIFCFCNIIIVFLLIDRSKSDMNHTPSSIDAFQIVLDQNTSRNDYENDAKVVEDDYMKEGSASEVQTEAPKHVDDDPQVAAAAASEAQTKAAKHVDNDTQEEQEQEELEQEEVAADDHELNARIEDFINKIHRNWRAERLRVKIYEQGC
ncbi:uncharacterized protein LOC110692584 [Chenopodium quinoa]|uniref:uncharacterized protein LOC110692584 n=1 Tax=Chenopodium quinoa TaxID=63459 RepID=UPI000B76DE7F|nr:uncharacterized protein LOC110692584 [Chenopodium quinoa]